MILIRVSKALYKKRLKNEPKNHRFCGQNDPPPSTKFLFLEAHWAIDFRSGPQVATEAQKVTTKIQNYNVNQYFIEQMSK